MPVLYFISCDLWTYVTFGRAVTIRAAMEAVSGFLLGVLAARGCMNFYIAAASGHAAAAPPSSVMKLRRFSCIRSPPARGGL
jgi:hypothetical protein